MWSAIPFHGKRLVYIDGRQAVIYRGLRPNPTLGQNFEAMDPLEWLARMADHIPDPGKHRTLFYAHYANRSRGERPPEEDGEGLPAKDEPPKKRRCSGSWARLISKIFHADPLTCRKCGAKLKVVAYLHDTVAIRQILDYLGVSPPEEPKPPPDVQEVVRVPVDEEGRELEAP